MSETQKIQEALKIRDILEGGCAVSDSRLAISKCWCEECREVRTLARTAVKLMKGARVEAARGVAWEIRSLF